MESQDPVSEQPHEQAGQVGQTDPDPGAAGQGTPQTPPDTSEHRPHAEEVAGRGGEDPDEMADEERYKKGPGW